MMRDLRDTVSDSAAKRVLRAKSMCIRLVDATRSLVPAVLASAICAALQQAYVW